MSTLVIRCSSLDRVLACAGSLEESDAPYTPNNPEATEGRAGHEALVALAAGGEPDVDGVAAKYGVSPDVVADLVRRGRLAWRDVERWFGGERIADAMLLEAPLADEVVLRGTPDLISVTVERISILDWKLGWQPSEHPNQLRGYAYLARARSCMPSSGYILGVEVWARRGEYRVHKFTAEDLDRLRDEVLVQARHRGRQFGPGPDACRYCPLQNGCQALAEYQRSGVTALVPVGENAPVTRELVGALYDRAKLLRAALDRYETVLCSMLDEGPVPLPDGRQIVWGDQEQEAIAPSKALAFLREELDLRPDEVDEILGITKAGLERVLKARAPKRQGAAYLRAALSRLRALGAITKVTKRRKQIA